MARSAVAVTNTGTPGIEREAANLSAGGAAGLDAGERERAAVEFEQVSNIAAPAG